MKIIFALIAIFLLLISTTGLTQDSTAHLEKAKSLIQDSKFASANDYLDTIIHEGGFQPAPVCLQIENALENHFFQRDYVSFYLIDTTAAKIANGVDKTLKITFLRYPDRLLQRVIDLYPDYGEAYKLFGDFYLLRLNESMNPNIVDSKAVKDIEEKIFQYYNKASQMGYNSPFVNLWLGHYYQSKNQFDNAVEFYQKNVNSRFQDTMTFFYLAEIFYQEKQYSQSYDFALKALPGLPLSKIDTRYKALRIASLSLLNLGEVERFKKYINECIRLLPDRQESYLALLEYYDQNKNVDKMETIIRTMLNKNPYDLAGYTFLENFVVKYDRYVFSEQLFANLMMKHENSDQVMGNIHWYRGNIAFHQGMVEVAKKLWEISRNYFSKYLPEDDPVLKRIGNISQKTYAN